MGKVVVCCPSCNKQVQVSRPDSDHPFYSTNKPQADEGIANYIEQKFECKNSNCASKFSIYWYEK